MSYTDIQLKQTLAKMLPDIITYDDVMNAFYWNRRFDGKIFVRVLNTELLHLCWLVEEELARDNYHDYRELYYRRYLDCYSCNGISATWQQRVIALAKVKGIEI